MKDNKTKQKTVDEYRRDIYTLKSKLKEEEYHLDQLKQKSSEVDIFVDHTYTFQMKVKILEDDLAAVKEKIFKYSRDEYAYFYTLNFCAYALSRACTIIGLSPEMVFRSADIEGKGKVKEDEFCVFLREVLRLDSVLFTPIAQQLNPQNKPEVKQERYFKFLRCFMIDTEKSNKEESEINEAVERVCIQMNNAKVQATSVWRKDLVNIASTAGALKAKIKMLDNLDCVAIYCRCDPNKEGAIKSEKVIKFIENKTEHLKNFVPLAKEIKLKK